MTEPNAKPKNWLLLKIRNLHIWLAPYALRAAPSPDQDVILGCGWRGPYLRMPLGTSELRDTWGHLYELAFDGSDRLSAVTTLGSAGTAGGTGYDADLAVVFDSVALFPRVSGRIKGAKTAGTTVDGDTKVIEPCTVRLFVPKLNADGTIEIEVREMEATSPNFTFQFDDVPVGVRVIRSRQKTTTYQGTTTTVTKLENKAATMYLSVPRGGLYGLELKLEDPSQSSDD